MKKSKKKSSPILSFVALLGVAFAIAAICMGFLPMITAAGKLTGVATGSLTGFEGAFGASAKAGDNPSWLIFANAATTDGMITLASKQNILIMMIVLAAGAILSLFGTLLKGKFGKFVLVFGALALIAGGVMSFFSINLCGFESAETLGNVYSLGIGAILTGSFAIAGGLLASVSGIAQLIK